MKVPIVDLHNVIPQKTIESVEKVIQSGYWVDGPEVHKLENEFADYCGTKHCRALCNGTAALMTILASAGLEKDDEVIVPSFTFIATANSVLHSQAKPVFADVDPNTFTIDPEDIEKKITPKTKAIMPVHLFGLCADMKAINNIAEENGLIVLEDAAQAHGATIDGKKAGSFGKAAGFSLYPTKNMFAGGEGGLITTNDDKMFKEMNLYMNHGQSKKYHHTKLGFNFRLAEINGVLARYSLHQVDEWNQKREENANHLSNLLADIQSLETPVNPKGFTHVHHQYTIKVLGAKREKLIAVLQDNNIGYGIHYAIPIHKQPYYKEIGYETVSLPNTEKLCKQVLSLPIHPLVEEKHLDYISKIIHDTLV